jgi:CubicO group peptidase (beta-lactamase class C family)
MATLDSKMPERVRAAAAEMIAEHQLPGISIGVVAGDDLVFCEGFGLADIEDATPMQPTRRQRIASITKTMVGMCAMSLVDDGKLSLDARAVDLLPDVHLEGHGATITVRHLLTHTSGIGEAPTLARLSDVANPDRQSVSQPGDFSSLYPDGIVVEVPAGTKWSYSNNGYALLGEIVSRAAGMSLQDLMQSRIWGPLRMESTDILDTFDERISTGYHRPPNEDNRYQLERSGVTIKDEPTVDGKNIRGKFSAEFNQGMRAAGGVQSTVPDMARYASALLKGGAGIVKRETFDAMTRTQYGTDERLATWGFSFARTAIPVSAKPPSAWPVSFGHGGAYYGGWNSHLDVFPALGIGVIQHLNIMMDEPAPIFRRIMRAVLDEMPAPYTAHAVDADILDSAPGIYELPMPGPLTNFRPQTRVGRVQIERDGDGLLLRSRWGKWKVGVPLVPCDPADPTFFAVQPGDVATSYVGLDRGADGRINGLHFEDLVQMQRRSD